MKPEKLEPRNLLSSVPFGATTDDTAEFMLGSVLVSVVLMESDGSIDADSEQWTREQIESVKENVREGLSWWEDLLQAESDVHTLDFQIDYTFADSPVATGYEPIARRSDDFPLWMNDFFVQANVARSTDFSVDIRRFNHAQREKHDTNWAFTIFVVNSQEDADGRFDSRGSFSRAFAFAGGRFFVMPHDRPASTVAHETAHMFWAYDEYAGSESYWSSRGYYNTQNANAADGNPDSSTRVASILDSHRTAYPLQAISPSAMEMVGWRDSDGDGVFDVLDVPHSLIGEGTFDPATGLYHFKGSSQVQTLPNQNTSGLGNDITINRINKVQYRLNDGPWVDFASFDDYTVDLDLVIGPVSAEAETIQIRSVDDRWGITSSVFSDVIDVTIEWHNAELPWDTNGDGTVSPVDALLIINRLNRGASGELGSSPAGPPYLDVSADGVLSPVDALLVINRLNQPVAGARAIDSVNAIIATAEGEPADISYRPQSSAAKLLIDPETLPDVVAPPPQRNSRTERFQDVDRGGESGDDDEIRSLALRAHLFSDLDVLDLMSVTLQTPHSPNGKLAAGP